MGILVRVVLIVAVWCCLAVVVAALFHVAIERGRRRW